MLLSGLVDKKSATHAKGIRFESYCRPMFGHSNVMFFHIYVERTEQQLVTEEAMREDAIFYRYQKYCNQRNERRHSIWMVSKFSKW